MRYIHFILPFLLFASSFSQIDTTRREFFPLHIGDLWQYRDESNQLAIQKVVADSIINNRRYFLLIHSLRGTGGVLRIDTLFRVQEYGGTLGGGDSCGGEAPCEWSVHRLNEAPGAVWRSCENFVGYFTSVPLIRFNRLANFFIFGQTRQVMYFDFGGIVPISGDTSLGPGGVLVRGIGVYREDYIEQQAYYQLAGAIINGVQYGTIVNVEDQTSRMPNRLTLEQNYPNPFNPATTIEYQLGEKSDVTLIVYNVLGQQITELVRGVQEPGMYKLRFDAETLPSGIYFYILRANEFMERRKMLYVR